MDARRIAVNALVAATFAVGFSTNFFSRFAFQGDATPLVLTFSVAHLLSLVVPAAVSYFFPLRPRTYLFATIAIVAAWLACSYAFPSDSAAMMALQGVVRRSIMVAVGLVLLCFSPNRLRSKILLTYAAAMLVIPAVHLVFGMADSDMHRGLSMLFCVLLAFVALCSSEAKAAIPSVKDAFASSRSSRPGLARRLLGRGDSVLSALIVAALLMVVLGALEGYAATLGLDMAASDASMLGAFAIMLAMGLASFRRDSPSWVPSVFALVMAACIAGLFLVLVVPGCLPLLSGLFGMATIITVASVCVIVVGMAKSEGVSLVFLYGTIQAVLSTIYNAGNLLNSFARDTLDSGMYDVTLIAAASLACIAALAVIAFLRIEKGGAAAQGPASGEGQAADAVKGELAALSDSDEKESAFLELAEQRGLSEREREIALLYAQGRSVPYISERCFISDTTVKSHLKKVYAKLGIHSKQELIDVVRL